MINIPNKITLIDLDPVLIDAWEAEFKAYGSMVEPRRCDYFDEPADCIVSPANSFGYMDGGLDRAIMYELGDHIERRVQAAISAEHHGELPVGSAVIVETGHESWPLLVAAPTMRVPEDVSNTVNAYLAFRAILLAIARFNAGEQKIHSLVCSGLATGIGKLSPSQCAVQMRMAYEACLAPARILNPREVYGAHARMTERD